MNPYTHFHPLPMSPGHTKCSPHGTGIILRAALEVSILSLTGLPFTGQSFPESPGSAKFWAVVGVEVGRPLKLTAVE